MWPWRWFSWQHTSPRTTRISWQHTSLRTTRISWQHTSLSTKRIKFSWQHTSLRTTRTSWQHTSLRTTRISWQCRMYVHYIYKASININFLIKITVNEHVIDLYINFYLIYNVTIFTFYSIFYYIQIIFLVLFLQ